MGTTAKVTISLPRQVLEAVEKEREARGESRSEFFRRAAEAELKRKQKEADIAAYIRGYQEQPETAEEIEENLVLAAAALAGEPWE